MWQEVPGVSNALTIIEEQRILDQNRRTKGVYQGVVQLADQLASIPYHQISQKVLLDDETRLPEPMKTILKQEVGGEPYDPDWPILVKAYRISRTKVGLSLLLARRFNGERCFASVGLVVSNSPKPQENGTYDLSFHCKYEGWFGPEVSFDDFERASQELEFPISELAGIQMAEEMVGFVEGLEYFSRET